MTATMSIAWPVPPVTETVQIYVRADPQDLVAELSEADNQAAGGGLVPGLVAEDVEVSYSAGQQVTVTVDYTNVGPARATQASMELRLDAETGTLISSTSLDELGPGDEMQAIVPWDVTAVPSGWHRVYAIPSPGTVVPAWQLEDNTGWAALAILPDLAISAEDITAQGTTVSAVVHNRGMRRADGVTAGLYGSWPVAGARPLAAKQTDLDAGQSRELVLSLPMPLCGLCAGVNIDGALEERDLSDNVALYGRVPRWEYLPLIHRNHRALG